MLKVESKVAQYNNAAPRRYNESLGRKEPGELCAKFYRLSCCDSFYVCFEMVLKLFLTCMPLKNFSENNYRRSYFLSSFTKMSTKLIFWGKLCQYEKCFGHIFIFRQTKKFVTNVLVALFIADEVSLKISIRNSSCICVKIRHGIYVLWWNDVHHIVCIICIKV